MELNDYYKILDLKYKYSALELFRKYLRKAKQALAINNEEQFVKIRMAFEVLRDNEVIDDYNRIYRKYILKEELNFPKIREEQMIENFKLKENLGIKLADKVIATNENYYVHFLKFVLQFIIIDLLNVINFGMCGLLFFGYGLFLIISFHTQISIAAGTLCILAGFYLFRRNIINVIIP